MSETPVPFLSLTSLAPRGPTHTFELESGEKDSRSAVYIRKDGQRIKWDDEFGWSARDEKSGALLTVAWGIPPASQKDNPPEGTWVSRKGAEAYVYELKTGVSKEERSARAQRLREATGGVEM